MLARGLADRARENGLEAAALDMDEIVEAIAGSDWRKIRHDDRLEASRLAVAMCDHLIDSGYRAIFVAGSTISSWEWAELRRRMRSQPKTLTVGLEVSLGAATCRAQVDETRDATRNPDVLRRLFEPVSFDTDMRVNTDESDAEAVCDLVAAWLGELH
jgi:hypothetical protein